MEGLRTQENIKFEHFFKLVQDNARSKKCTFFLDCGEGNEFETSDMEGEDLCGWLIPDDLKDEFLSEWESNISDKWSDFICWVFWEKNRDNTISVKIKV